MIFGKTTTNNEKKISEIIIKRWNDEIYDAYDLSEINFTNFPISLSLNFEGFRTETLKIDWTDATIEFEGAKISILPD